MDQTKYENKKYVNSTGIDIHGIKPGQEFDVKVDSEGTPLEKKWRRRVADGDCLKEVKKTKKSGGKK